MSIGNSQQGSADTIQKFLQGQGGGQQGGGAQRGNAQQGQPPPYRQPGPRNASAGPSIGTSQGAPQRGQTQGGGQGQPQTSQASQGGGAQNVAGGQQAANMLAQQRSKAFGRP